MSREVFTSHGAPLTPRPAQWTAFVVRRRRADHLAPAGIPCNGEFPHVLTYHLSALSCSAFYFRNALRIDLHYIDRLALNVNLRAGKLISVGIVDIQFPALTHVHNCAIGDWLYAGDVETRAQA